MSMYKLKIDDKNLRRGFDDFKSANKIATKRTLNTVAALSRRNAVKKVRSEFTLRNTFTIRNIQFEQAKSNTISKMVSRVGATERADYMEKQEFGGARKKRGKETSIGQKEARSGGSTARPVARKHYISRVRNRMVKGAISKNFKSRKARGVAVMAMAYKKKLFIRRNNSIFMMTFFSSQGGRVRARMVHLYYMEKKTMRITKEPWLEPSIQKPVQDMFNIYKSQLKKLWKSANFK